MELEAARFFNSSCRVVNPTTTQHLPSTFTPDYTGHGVWTTRKITTLVLALNNDKPVTMDTKLASTGKAVDELPTSQPTLTDLNTPLSNPTSSSVVISSSVTQDESTGVQTACAMSWQLAVCWALFIVLFVMIDLAVGYVIKRQRGRLECKNVKKKKKKKKKKKNKNKGQRILAKASGFPEVRLPSRSGELDLSALHHSIEVGSYNTSSGTIVYEESF